MYTTGSYSYKDIEKKLYEKGLRSKSGKKVSHALLHHCLKNTFYHGIMFAQNDYHKGIHKPIISKKLFDECEAIRKGHNKPRRQKHVFPFRGLLTCEKCSCLITAEKQRGLDYYHCTNGKGICDQKKVFIRGEKLEEQIFEKLEEFSIDDEMIEIMYESALEKFHSENENKDDVRDTLQKELKALKSKESKLLDTMLEGKVSDSQFAEKSKSMKLEILNLEQLIGKNRVNIKKELSTFEQAKNAFKTLQGFKSEYFQADVSNRRVIMFELLSNMTLKDRIVPNLQQKMPYSLIANRAKNGDFSTMLHWLDSVRKEIIIKN
jgi:hypothetical protein